MSLWLLLSVWGIYAIAAMSPWPDFVVAVKNSLKYWRINGIWTALGFGLWVGTHLLYLALWLWFIVSQSIIVFSVIKYLWVVYLLRLWLNALFSKWSSQSFDVVSSKESISAWTAFKQWYITNILNPKATLFYLSLFTITIGWDVWWSMLLIVSIWIVLTVFLWFVFVSYVLTIPLFRKRYLKIEVWINRVLWSILTLLAIKIAFDD